MSKLCNPLQSLRSGHWFKLICGASYQYLPAVQNLAWVYGLAGVDCIDVAADPAVVTAARQGLDRLDPALARPWLMVSLNDGEDPHFRKAQFDPATCPPDCPRPCAQICPALAIALPPQANGGVVADRCYGCGRCLPLCPHDRIQGHSTVCQPQELLPPILALGIDAVEIHTQIDRRAGFLDLWQVLLPHLSSLKLVAISCPAGTGAVDYLWSLYRAIAPLPCPLIWQADGRPMSGDIGAGTTHATLTFAQALLAQGPPGYVQVAGGTNAYTVPKLGQLGLLRSPESPLLPLQGSPWVAGAAYGSYARRWLAPWLETLGTEPDGLDPADSSVSRDPPGLMDAVARAKTLVLPLKQPHLHQRLSL
ncbi:circadian clock protein LdpA [Prochlorothrix hollandica]|uniref:circadian clock protein LdpA n=1 Tax=Prochlorothrix hollandica TaxID=1223 RepID=UPI0033428376